MKCTKTTEQDSLQMAKLHKAFIPTGFLSQQSLNFLQALYLYLIKHEIVYVVKEEGKVVGFIAGSLHTEGLFKRFFKSNIGLLMKFALNNLFSVKFLRKAVETLKAPQKTAVNDSGSTMPELLSIVVDQNYAGRGYGKKMLGCLEEELKTNHAQAYKVIVGSMLEANRFYADNGFAKEKEIELHRGDLSYIYVKKL